LKRQYDHLYKNVYGIMAVAVCVLLLVPVLRLIPVDAQMPTSPIESTMEPELGKKIQTFFESLKKGSASAIDDFLRNSNSPLAPPQSSSASLGTGTSSSLPTTGLRTKVDECKIQFGDIHNWEKIEEKKVGNDVIMFRYVLKYDQCPVIWTFTFYRKPSNSTSSSSSLPSTPSNPWTLIALNFDTNIL